jgi:formate hydrogenlyase subunit 6/NADH:ubiquinone oxidoreductase subunit I
MTKLALKWVFRKPATSRYPFVPRKPLLGSRGALTFEGSTCIHCTICAKKCPTAAILVDRDKKKWGIDRLRCINCGACVEACPKKSLELSVEHMGPTVTKDREFH